MKVLLIVLVVLVLAVLGVLIVIALRFGRRSYQRYTGLERQRGSAKQLRDAGFDRLKHAERLLVEGQRELAGLNHYSEAQDIERLRSRLSTAADRLKHATYGYSPVGSPNPVRETELAELQARDAESVADAQAIVDLAENVRSSTRQGNIPDLQPLQSSLELFEATLDRRRAVN
jgi:cell division protein FtsB